MRSLASSTSSHGSTWASTARVGAAIWPRCKRYRFFAVAVLWAASPQSSLRPPGTPGLVGLLESYCNVGTGLAELFRRSLRAEPVSEGSIAFRRTAQPETTAAA